MAKVSAHGSEIGTILTEALQTLAPGAASIGMPSPQNVVTEYHRRVFAEGAAARARGDALNPYRVFTTDWRVWRDGYESGNV